MTNPRLRNLAALLSFAILAVFVSSCAQPTGPAANGSRSLGATPPTWSSSNFNLATPVLSISQTGEGEITLVWPNGRTEASIVDGGQYYPVNWTGANVAHGVKNGSQHTDVFMWNAETSAWVLYSQPVGQSLVITDLADGEYTFYVKEKSKENSTAKNTETFHSFPSEVVTVEVHTSCLAENTFDMVLLEQLNQNDNDKVQLDPENDHNIIAKSPSGKFNLHVGLNASCDEWDWTDESLVVTFHVDGTSNTVTATRDPDTGKWIANNIVCSTEMDVAKNLIIMIGDVELTGWTVTCTE
jgi:hypothetical protein